MSVEYTILGVLMDEPTHGYSIKKHLLGTVSKSLGLNDGQLYPALARLEGKGWIEKQVVPQPRSPTKHLYRVTREGEAALFAWLQTADPGGEPAAYDFFWRDDFLRKCSFFRYLPAETVASQARGKLEEVDARIAELEEFLARMEQGQSDPYRRMIVDYGIRYQRMRRTWIGDLLARALEAGLEERPLPGHARVASGPSV